MHEALELRRQHQEDDEQGQSEGEHQTAARLLVFQGLALVVDPCLVRERFANDPFEELESVAQDRVRCQAR